MLLISLLTTIQPKNFQMGNLNSRQIIVGDLYETVCRMMGRVIDFSSRCLEDEWSGNAFVINCLFFNAVTIALSFFIVPFSTTWQHHLSLVGYLLCINND